MRRLGRTLERARFRNKALRRPLNWYRHRGIGEQDKFLVTFPRSGTTWMRFLLSETLTGREVAFPELGRIIPYIGQHHDVRPYLPNGGRMIQTHETWKIGNPPTVYLVRDPRSVVISQYHWLKRRELVDDFDPFLDNWLAGTGMPWRSWSDHVNFWLNSSQAEEGNLHVVRYEELREDTEGALARVLEFIAVPASKERVAEVVANNTLEKMRIKEDRAPRRHATTPEARFVRTGSVGGWKQELRPEQQQRITDSFRQPLSILGYPTA